MSDYKSEEEKLGKAYDSKLMKRLLGYIKPYKNYVIFAIILNIVVAALGPVRPLLTKIAIDDYIAKFRLQWINVNSSGPFWLVNAAGSCSIFFNLLYTVPWSKGFVGSSHSDL